MPDVKVGAARDLPVNKDMAWDGPASAKSIFAWAGFDGDSPDASKARQGFLCYDASAEKLRGSYHLPFARVLDGTLTALASGIRAAASRLPQTDIPDSVKASAQGVIDGYKKKAGIGDSDGGSDGEKASKPVLPDEKPADDDGDGRPKEQQPKGNARPVTDLVAKPKDQTVPDEDLEATDGSSSMGRMAVYAFRAPLVRAPSLTPPDPEKVALDPDIFAQDPPYTFRAQISNDQLDAYYTRMHPSSLRNYAADAQEGVSLQNSHRADELPMGRTYRGQYSTPSTQPDQIAKTHADFYVIPGLKLNDVHSDDLIRGVKSGVVRDVSVGFYNGRYRCTLCDRDLLGDDACGHIPGITYRLKDAATGADSEEPAAAWIHDARLAEVSTVYDGATPGATIVKAKQMAEAGRLNAVQARLLEARYRGLRLYGSQRYFARPEVQFSVSAPPGTRLPTAGALLQEVRMSGSLSPDYDASNGLPATPDEQQGLPKTVSAAEAVRALFEAEGFDVGPDPLAAVRRMIQALDQQERAGPPPALRAAPLASAGSPPGPPPAERAPAAADQRHLQNLQQFAALGQDIQNERLAKALSEGGRAFGEKFDRAAQEERLRGMTPAQLQLETESWTRIGDALFPGGRRAASDQERQQDDPRAKPDPANAAYAA